MHEDNGNKNKKEEEDQNSDSRAVLDTMWMIENGGSVVCHDVSL